MASQEWVQCCLPCPSCTYSFLGRTNHTAQPWLPEVPLPGAEPSALLASLSFPSALFSPGSPVWPGSGLNGKETGGPLAPT